jgi:5-methylcytosine-specific restriction endonuclease McrA
MPHKDREKYLAYKRAYYKAHREAILAQQQSQYPAKRDYAIQKSRDWYSGHREQTLERQRLYRQAHKEKIKQAARLWRGKKTEQTRQKEKDWRIDHRDDVNANNRKSYAKQGREIHNIQQRVWRKANPEKAHAYVASRRATKKRAPLNDLDAAQWTAITTHYGHRCVYCGRKMARLTQDHLTPLSQGGSHTASNVVPACQSCNSKKGTRKPLLPVQPLLLVPSFKEVPAR